MNKNKQVHFMYRMCSEPIFVRFWFSHRRKVSIVKKCNMLAAVARETHKGQAKDCSDRRTLAHLNVRKIVSEFL